MRKITLSNPRCSSQIYSRLDTEALTGNLFKYAMTGSSSLLKYWPGDCITPSEGGAAEVTPCQNN